jgi:hypothetical protein
MTELRRDSLKGAKGFFKDSVYRDIKEKLEHNGIREKQEAKEIKREPDQKNNSDQKR